jgi:hypothetical protein
MSTTNMVDVGFYINYTDGIKFIQIDPSSSFEKIREIVKEKFNLCDSTRFALFQSSGVSFGSLRNQDIINIKIISK